MDKKPPAYPSLREHLLTRRDVLSYLGASFIAGSGVLAVGCGQGEPSAPGAAGDASTSYLTIRVPQQDDLTVELAEGGQCRFFVNALTYHQDTYDDFVSLGAEAEQACAEAVRRYTHDSLSTAAGVPDAEVDVRDSMNALSPGIALATLTILALVP